MHLIDHFRPLEFPGVAEAEPFVGIFVLPALRDDLAEQAEIVADAVADGGDRQRRHALHEAGGKPPEAAIAERRIRLAFAQFGKPDAEIAECGLEHRQQPHIVQGIAEQPADQEFQAEVIDPLAAGIVALLLRGEPAVHDAVAQRQRRRLVPVVPGRHAGVLADRQPQLGEDRALDLGQREFVDRLVGRRKICRGTVGLPNLDPAIRSSWNNTRLMPGSKPARGSVCAVHAWLFMQGLGRFATSSQHPFGDRMEFAPEQCREKSGRARKIREGIGHETNDRNCRHRFAGSLHQRVECGVRCRARPPAAPTASAAPSASRNRLRPPRAAPRSAGNAAENSTPIIAATRCCRRCEAMQRGPAERGRGSNAPHYRGVATIARSRIALRSVASASTVPNCAAALAVQLPRQLAERCAS